MTAPQLLTGLLQSNDAPLPSQIQLGDAISRIEDTLRGLRRKHADLALEMDQYLPREIIEDIFLYFVPSMHPHSDLDDPTSGKDHWRLGHVCRAWRAISLHLSELWSVVDLGSLTATRPSLHRVDEEDDEKFFTELPAVNYPREDQEGYATEIALDFVAQCLARSRNRPLSLRLWKARYHFALPVLDALLAHSARSWTVIERLSSLTEDLQQLRKIVFVDHSIDTFRFQCAPNLTDLTLVRIFLPTNSDVVPWAQLTRYCEIDCIWWNTSVRVECYRHLTNLSVLFLKQLRMSPDGWTSILLPRLRQATFIFDALALEMPVLEVMHIKHAANEYYGSLPLPASSLRLKILRIQMRYPCITQGGLELALQLFPDLTEIHIDAPNVISDAAISRLVPNRDQLLPLSPRLEVIRLSNRSFVHETCEWRMLVDLLHARFQPTVEGVSALRMFEFVTSDWARDENVAAGLRTLGSRNHWDIRVSDREFPAWDES
ncbi:hypothetical protein C8R46DRAFT_1074161 [Mycena filopes]|nr:hypothetical protein C8R46DRAFT_1074161 [Mycena filopes]